MSYFLLFLSLTGWALAGARVVRNPCYGLLWGQSALAVLLYTFAVAGLLHPGALLAAVAGVLYLLYALVLLRGGKSHDFRVVVAASALAFVLALSNSTGMRFFAWDEFSHWGLQLKFLATNHVLQTDNLDVMFADYIPGLSLYRYLGSVFHLPFEPGASLLNWYLAYTCLLALAAGTAGAIRERAGLAAAAMVVMGFFGYFLFFQGLVATMYVDPLQGLLLLACLVWLPQAGSSARPFLSLAPLLVLIVLVKHVGIVFAGMAVGLFLVTAYAEAGRVRARDIKLASAWLAVCLLYFFSWKLYVIAHDLQPAYQLAAGKLISADGGFGAALAENIWAVLHGAFPHAQFFGSPVLPFDPGMRYLWQVIVATGVVVLVLYAVAGRDIRKSLGLILVYLALCLFAFLVFLSMVRGMSAWHADIWSFSRYFATLLFASGFFALIYTLRKMGGWKPAVALSAFTVAATVLVTPGISKLFYFKPRQAPLLRVASDDLAREVLSKIPAGSTAWHIYDADDGFKYYVYRYALYPVRLLGIAESWRYLSAENLRNPLNESNSPQAFADTLKHVDYVIVDRPNPEFWARYGQFFPDRDHRLYRVDRTQDGEVQLRGV